MLRGDSRLGSARTRFAAEPPSRAELADFVVSHGLAMRSFALAVTSLARVAR